MRFWVDIPAARGLPSAFRRMEQDAKAAQDYVKANTALNYGHGLLAQARGSHQAIVDHLHTYLHRIEYDVAFCGAAMITSALNWYDNTDRENAGKLDDSWPGATVDRTELGPYSYDTPGGAQAFTDRFEPQARLTALPDYDNTDEYRYAPAVGDAASPTSGIRDTIWGATWLAAKIGVFDRPYDVFEEWTKPLAGDWTGVRQCADVFNNVALAVRDMGENSRWHALGVDAVWGGNGADALIVNCWTNGKKMIEWTPLLQETADRYQTSAEAMFEIGKVVGSLIMDLSDAAMVFAAAMTGAGGTPEAGIGPLVLGGASLYEAYRMWDITKEIMDLMGRADAASSAVASAAGDLGFIGSLGPIADLPPTATVPDLPMR